MHGITRYVHLHTTDWSFILFGTWLRNEERSRFFEWCIFSRVFHEDCYIFDHFTICLFISDLCCESFPPHILTLINKVAAVQISRLYLMSTSTPGLSPILSLCFETDGYYYNKKVANYFSSRRQKQLTTGIMCWLKSIPVSVKGERNSNFPLSQLAYIHCSEYPNLDLTTAVVHLGPRADSLTSLLCCR